MWPLLAGREKAIRMDLDWLGWELFGNRAIRQGDWKLLYLLKGAGGTALAVVQPQERPRRDARSFVAESRRNAAMLKLWDEYFRINGVIVSDAGPFANREP